MDNSERSDWIAIGLWGLVLVVVVPRSALSLAGIAESGLSDVLDALLVLAAIPAVLAIRNRWRSLRAEE